MNTEAVMCIALTSTSPSRTPLTQAGVYLVCNVDKRPPGRYFEPQFFAVGFHRLPLAHAQGSVRTLDVDVGAFCNGDVLLFRTAADRHSKAKHALAGAFFFEIAASSPQHIIQRHHTLQIVVIRKR